jgi:hypothetical protein
MTGELVRTASVVTRDIGNLGIGALRDPSFVAGDDAQLEITIRSDERIS